LSDLSLYSENDEVKRYRSKYLAIRRAQRRLENRLLDIDWELDVLKPELERSIEKSMRVGELPAADVTGREEDPRASQDNPT
jgi:hypothetical protein